MNGQKIIEENIDIYFDMPLPPKELFDFIIKPSSMTLYKGFMLIPGIKTVDSSDVIRKAGTRDSITNADGSSHSSLTIELVSPSIYNLEIGQIRAVGYKKLLAPVLSGFKEQWTINPSTDGKFSKVHRRLVVLRANNLLSKLIVRFALGPQLKQSLLIHHKNIIKVHNLTPL